jgi:hypothetical protein
MENIIVALMKILFLTSHLTALFCVNEIAERCKFFHSIFISQGCDRERKQEVKLRQRSVVIHNTRVQLVCRQPVSAQSVHSRIAATRLGISFPKAPAHTNCSILLFSGPGLKQPKLVADHSRPSSFEVNN